MKAKPRHPCPTEAELKSVAQRPVLHKHEAILLIQGFCPDRGSACKGFMYLDEYATQVGKIKTAEAKGEIAFPIKVTELVIWCNENDVALPEIFVDEVTTKIIRVRRPKAVGIFTDELVRWSDNDHNRQIVRRGRKQIKEATVRGYESTIVNQARKFVRDFVQKTGGFPPKKSVNYHLAKSTGRPESEINRAFSLDALLTPAEINFLRKKFRLNLRQDIKNRQYPPKT